VILIVRWMADDALNAGAVAAYEETVLEAGALVGNLRRVSTLLSEYGPITPSALSFAGGALDGVLIMLPCLAHFVQFGMYTDAAPANPQLVNLKIEMRIGGDERSAVI
jgi:hypothetical protein